MKISAEYEQAYGKTKLLYDKALGGEEKGTVLLIHGTAPMNIDGIIPCNPSLYGGQPLYAFLARDLNELGWNTVRYTRTGVYEDKVDWVEYGVTDLANIVGQLDLIWDMLPQDKPRVASN